MRLEFKFIILRQIRAQRVSRGLIIDWVHFGIRPFNLGAILVLVILHSLSLSS